MSAAGTSAFAERFILAASVLAIAVLVAALDQLEIQHGASVAAGAANLAALWPFWITSALCWTALSALWLLLCRDPANALVRAAGGRAASIALIIAVAAAARVAVLALHEPALSDDVNRYVFDGRNLAAGINPYRAEPAARRDAIAAGAAEHWPGEGAAAASVNNPELHTIYLPAAQWIFGATGLLVPDAVRSPAGAARWYRAAMIAFDLAAIIALLALLRGAGRSPWWAALYAWHPLPISEIAGSGHQEAIGLALLAMALLVWQRGFVRGGSAHTGRALPVRVGPRPERRLWRVHGGAGPMRRDSQPSAMATAAWSALLAAAALAKPVVLPIALLLLRGRPLRTWLISAATGAAVVALLSAPLLLTDGGVALANLASTAERFTLKWAHFGGVYEPLLWTIEHATPAWSNDAQERLARAICAIALLAVIVLVVQRSRSTWSGARWIFFAMVLLSPAVHPWYLLWALMLVPMGAGADTGTGTDADADAVPDAVPDPDARAPIVRERSFAAERCNTHLALWIASLTLPWGYVAWTFGPRPDGAFGWHVPPWVLVAAWAPVFAALVYDLRPRRRRAAR